MRVLNLAPACGIPPRDGADRRVWHLNEGLVDAGVGSRLVARSAVVETDGTQSTYEHHVGWRDRKAWVALLAAVTGRDYWQLKMLGPGVRRMAHLAASDRWDGLILNFLYALPLLTGWEGNRSRFIVETHNYDPGVFGGFRDATRNPLQRWLCSRAIQTSRRALSWLPAGTVLVHVSETDREAWRRDRPDLRHEVVENGCTVRPRSRGPDYSGGGACRLLFVGSLSAQMNQSALDHFAQRYWPKLRTIADFTVAGSRPSERVRAQAQREGWTLRADVSDSELEALYDECHYAVLPFAYGAGSKLKLFEACGRGVPVLATLAGVTGIETLPPLVQAVDAEEAWFKTVQQKVQPSTDSLTAMLDFAQRFSWPRLAVRMKSILESAPEVIFQPMKGRPA